MTPIKVDVGQSSEARVLQPFGADEGLFLEIVWPSTTLSIARARAPPSAKQPLRHSATLKNG